MSLPRLIRRACGDRRRHVSGLNHWARGDRQGRDTQMEALAQMYSTTVAHRCDALPYRTTADAEM